MKNFKKIAAATLSATMLLSSAAFASNEYDTMLISEDYENEIYLNVSGTFVENANVYKNGEDTMIPLRKTLEALGYEIGWKDDVKTVTISKGVHYAELDTVNNLFAFGRMAHQPVSEKFEIIHGTTYVDNDFIENIEGISAKETEGTVYVGEVKNVTVAAVEDGRILAYDATYPQITDVDGNVVEEGNVYLMISEETEILLGEEKVELSEIKEGDVLEVLYAPAMTMSLPPQTLALTINVIR